MPMPMLHAWFREGGARKAKEGGGRERKGKKEKKVGWNLTFKGQGGQVRDLGLVLFGRLQPVAEAFDRLLLILRPGPNAPGLS